MPAPSQELFVPGQSPGAGPMGQPQSQELFVPQTQAPEAQRLMPSVQIPERPQGMVGRIAGALAGLGRRA